MIYVNDKKVAIGEADFDNLKQQLINQFQDKVITFQGERVLVTTLLQRLFEMAGGKTNIVASNTIPSSPINNTLYWVLEYEDKPVLTTGRYIVLVDNLGTETFIGTTDIDLSGYYTKVEIDELKQDKLVSGTNIKTINNENILGSGNIDIQAGVGTETTLWAGNFTLDNTCTLSDNINNYDFLKFRMVEGGSYIFMTMKVSDWNKTIPSGKSQMLIPVAWNSTDRRIIIFVYGSSNTALKVNINGSLYLQEIIGIKGNIDISTLSFQQGIANGMTSVSAGTNSWTVNVTVPAGITPTGYFCSTEGNVGTVYISNVLKTSDTNIRLSGWYSVGRGASVNAQVNWIKLVS